MENTSVKKQNNGNFDFRKILLVGIPILVVLLLLLIIPSFFKKEEIIETNKDGEESVRGELGALSIDIADGFETSESNNDNYKRYSLASDTDYCYLVIKNTQKGSYTSAKDYIEKNIYVDDIEKASELKSKEIHKKKWDTVTIDDGISKTVQYAIEETDKIYSVEYVISKDSGVCSKEIEKMIDSMEINKK